MCISAYVILYSVNCNSLLDGKRINSKICCQWCTVRIICVAILQAQVEEEFWKSENSVSIPFNSASFTGFPPFIQVTKTFLNTNRNVVLTKKNGNKKWSHSNQGNEDPTYCFCVENKILH